MSDPLGFTRREFLHTGLAVVSTISTVPGFLQQSALALTEPGRNVTSRPGVPEERILVVVQLSGGNDGLNTVVPFGMDAYYKARPMLAVPREQVLPVDARAGIGLNPELGAIKEMMEAGQAGVTQGVGYPNPNRSHFASMDIWHTADVRGGKGLGWIGKAMDQASAKQGGEVGPCVCIGNESPLAAQGRLVKPVTFENANQFRWTGSDVQPQLQAAYDKLNRGGAWHEIPQDQQQAAFVMRTALDAQVASDRIRQAVAKGPMTKFPGGPLANQLRMVAAMIRAELPTRVYYVGLGGFDTHAGQPGRHGTLLRQFATAMQWFYEELKAMGQDGRVLSLAFSEFGRRVAQNASNGTDHGTAGPVFTFGPMVRPGLLGTHPDLSPQQLDDGDLVHTVDFRCLYATVLEQWMKVDSRAVLGQSFQQAAILDPKVRA